MLYRISFAERCLTDIASIFRSRLRRLVDLLRAGTVPLSDGEFNSLSNAVFGFSLAIIVPEVMEVFLKDV